MASPVWNSFAARSLGIGGIGQFCAWVLPGSEDLADAVSAVAVLVADAQVAWGDPAAVRVDLPLGMNGLAFQDGLKAGPVVVSFFAQITTGWVAGPVVALDLTKDWTAQFEYPKIQVVDTLQQIERDIQPLGPDLRLEIRGSYPRDDVPMPCVSVQFESSPQSQRLLADSAQALDATTLECRLPWNVTLTQQMWCETPEDRDSLAPWFQSAMTALMLLAPFRNFAEPSFQLQESEDFSRALTEKPLFILAGTLSGTVWSKFTVPIHNWVGHLTV
jgi:hypothetical protein